MFNSSVFELEPNWAGYNVKWSPFQPNRLATVASQNYGLIGKGQLSIIDHRGFGTVDNGKQFEKVRLYQHDTDSLTDCCWSELRPDLVWAGAGNGSILAYDLSLEATGPVQTVQAHRLEISSLHFSLVRSDAPRLLSASWDQLINCLDPITGQQLLGFFGHEKLVYEAIWSPRLRSTFASVSGDGTMRIWSSESDPRPKLTIQTNCEQLSCDWCKYNDNIVVTGGADARIRCWDLRSPQAPIVTLNGHEKAVKKVRFSPFAESLIGSCSYDTSTRIWDVRACVQECPNGGPSKALLHTVHNHREFVYGFDWSVLVPNVFADCGWDRKLTVTNLQT